jgi:hypothetical protein
MTMPDENWEELADRRFNKELKGFKDIKSKEEYFAKLEDYFSQSESGLALLNARRRSWSSIREEMFDGQASEVVASNQEKLTEEAKSKADAFSLASRFEDRRPASSRRRDEMRTAKDTRRVSMMTYRSWRRNPTRFDLRGIDTRRKRAFKVSKRDKRLQRYVAFINRGNRMKQYRSVKSGKFVKNPFKK